MRAVEQQRKYYHREVNQIVPDELGLIRCKSEAHDIVDCKHRPQDPVRAQIWNAVLAA
jgi:hypothetical protein